MVKESNAGVSNNPDEENLRREEQRKKQVSLKILSRTNTARNRVDDTCDRFMFPAQLTLYFAIGLACAGLIPLAKVIFIDKIDPSTAQSVTSIIASKWPYISLVIFVEFVAGVLLKIYYKQLDEMKYYVNESTNISIQSAVLYSLINSDRSECLDQVMIKMVDIERNRILKKGETTEEIERMKNEKQSKEIDPTKLMELFLASKKK